MVLFNSSTVKSISEGYREDFYPLSSDSLGSMDSNRGVIYGKEPYFRHGSTSCAEGWRLVIRKPYRRGKMVVSDNESHVDVGQMLSRSKPPGPSGKKRAVPAGTHAWFHSVA